ncbi:MAG: glycosyltransferase [Solirubrobacteraceae bacterium]
MSAHVVLLRGHSVAPWDLRPHERLAPDYRVSVLVGRRNLYATDGLDIERRPARALSDVLPDGPLGRAATRAAGERFLALEAQLRDADIVHAAELGNWYSAQAARLKPRLGFRLVVTTWETLPLRDAYRNVRTRPYARSVLAAADRFLPTTARARDALLLEGAAAERIVVCPPGIDVDRFALARSPRPPADGSHLVLSAGRLVWEKGHQDLLRALALLRLRGREDVRALIVGDGPEAARLRALAGDLGLAGVVEFRAAVPYEEMPALYAQASCLVLASLPVRFWEEQFGMVLAEAMAGHLPIVASASGAIPEVVGGGARYVSPGDWVGLAQALQEGPLAGAPGARMAPEEGRLERFSAAAAAERLRSIYDELLSG